MLKTTEGMAHYLLTYLLTYLRQRRHCIETVGTPVLRHSRGTTAGVGIISAG